MPASDQAVVVELDVEVTIEGHKSSEGDGRTAADLERERDQRAEGAEEDRPDGPE